MRFDGAGGRMMSRLRLRVCDAGWACLLGGQEVRVVGVGGLGMLVWVVRLRRVVVRP